MNKEKLKTILDLFLTFVKIGGFTFGGGYAMIPLIQKETVENKKWISDRDILDIIAIAESTPGPIAINSSTFVGYKTAGFWGAVAATSGVVLPSFFIILIISAVLAQFQNLEVVKNAFFGIRAGVLALLVKAWLSMYKQSKKEWFTYAVAAAAFAIAFFLDCSILLVILGCAAAGLIFSAATRGKEAAK